nr:MAG TPA: hypothetical protein [Caudoviricetes sp.]
MFRTCHIRPPMNKTTKASPFVVSIVSYRLYSVQ